MNLMQVLGSTEMGLIFAIATLGIYISFRVLDFPDLTVNGTFPMGACIAAICIVNGVNPWLATAYAFAGGALAGSLTAFIHVRFQIMGLLASILTMTALYSINLRITNLRPNVPMMEESTIFTYFEGLLPHTEAVIALTALVFLGLGFALWWLLQSQMGLGLRATGANPIMAKSQGVHIDRMKFLGICLSNGLVALSAALFTQSQGYADVNMGAGTIVEGLAAVIIGEVIFPPRSVLFSILGCLLGSLFYRFAIAVALNSDGLGLEPTDLNLITAAIVAFALILPRLKNKTFGAFKAGGGQ